MFLMGPQTPECTISKGFVACLSVLLPSFTAYCLPSVYALQNKYRGGRISFYLGLCPSPYFLVHIHSSHSNDRVSYVKASSTGPPPAQECTKLAASVPYTTVKIIWYKVPSHWAITTMLQHTCICVQEIAPSTRSTKICSSKASWSATLAYETNMWCELYFVCPLFQLQQQWTSGGGCIVYYV